LHYPLQASLNDNVHLVTPFSVRVSTILRGVLLIAPPWLLHIFTREIALFALLPLSFFNPTAAYNVSSKRLSLVWLGDQVTFTKLNHSALGFCAILT
jgi:hypothetical protein